MRLALAVVLVVAGVALRAQETTSPITLDVVVDENLQRAHTLTGTDFSVTEAGQPLSVISARLVQMTPETAPLPPITTGDDELAAATVAGRLVGIYIDEYH